MKVSCDVAIIGGGPAGSTCATLLKKYNPSLSVVLVEREKFPRDHIGESHLPIISAILDEMGVWDKVEGAGFPIKLGASYRWGQSEKLWDFEFIPYGDYRDEVRPAKYTGQRVWTAFQVERSMYDKILLDHAAERGADVRQETAVKRVMRGEGEARDRVLGLEVEGPAGAYTLEARHYVDASGNAAVVRRALEVPVTVPTKLMNVAMWDYWDNAEWAVKIGVGATRTLILSIGCGWIWFIPLGPTRTSIGFVCPAEYYRKSGKTPRELYDWAMSKEPLIGQLTAKATREGNVRATKDWSFLSERLVGENWFLAGECAGFADPILSAGMTLAHAGAREVAYTILELDRGELDAAWLKERYQTTNKRRITQHIRFADFWYAGNGIFTDIEAYTTEIAGAAGISLDPKEAFRWISNGGFLDDIPGRAGIGGLDFAGTKKLTEMFTADGKGDVETELSWKINEYNVFRLELEGAREEEIPILRNGRMLKAKCWVRQNRTLPLVGAYNVLFQVLKQVNAISDIGRALTAHYQNFYKLPPPRVQFELQQSIQALEVMLMDGWVVGSLDPTKGRLTVKDKGEKGMIHANRDVAGKAAAVKG
ncbi:MAG: tryptophan 7-halogenase [Phycisphaerales bacterium]|nr:tryptophan 7-halogenase [Phycisphaerales bacterium]